ncbi:MAG: CotH kinase family protein [Lachnospiraceae bacterium]|nr:CotH kinase family protein [Lachnospiraceae bacterium]
MTKNKLIFMVTAVAVILLAWYFKEVEDEVGRARYDQAREEFSEEELGEKPQSQSLVSHLPLISIDTKGQQIPGDAILDEYGTVAAIMPGPQGQDRIVAEMEVRDKKNSWHNLEDKADYKGNITIHIRGNSSRNFDKKSYRIELLKDGSDVKKEKESIAGMNKGSSYILNGPFLDKTLIRNYMWMNISGQLLKYTPDVRFCELTLDGEYQGLYVLMEPIEVSEERVALSEYTSGDPVLSYIIHLETKTEPQLSIEEFAFYTRRLEEKGRYEITYPKEIYLTESVKDYIVTDFSEIEQVIYSYEAGSDDEFYLDYIDEDSFVDYYIINELVGNSDAFLASTYFYKDARGKLHIGPVWDFNNCLDNFFYELPAEEFIVSERGWYSQLMKSKRFVNKVLSRYKKLRQGILSDKYLTDYIHETEQWMGSAIDRNFQVWGYSFDYTKLTENNRRSPDAGGDKTLEDVNPSNYQEANEMMEWYLLKRSEWLDENIETLLQYCQESKNANTTLY